MGGKLWDCVLVLVGFAVLNHNYFFLRPLSVCVKSAGWLLNEEDTVGWFERGTAVESLGGGVRGTGSGGRGRRQPGLAIVVGLA